jgi:hypothetical protein
MSPAAVATLTGGRLGTFDVACPSCGPERRSPANRSRKVLRIWRPEPSFATFHCVRCAAKGYSRDGRSGTDVGRTASDAVRAEIEARDRKAAAERRRKAQWLWRRRQPADATIVECYLRDVRGIVGPIPPTIGFLPATDVHAPAMIAAFAIPDEPEPGVLAAPPSEQIAGVHVTRLQPDGSGKAGEPAKIMIGRSIGSPVVLAPLNNLLGLAIVEGIETGLSIRDATGLGVWAAGAASRMPALADAVPHYVDCVSVMVEDDEAGRQHAPALLESLGRCGIHAEPLHVVRAADGV